MINYLLWDRGDAGLSLDQPDAEHAIAAADAEFRYRGYDSLRLDLTTEEVLEAFLDADNVAVRTTNTALTHYHDHETLFFRGSGNLAITASAALGDMGGIGGTGGSSASAGDQAGRADRQREGHWPTSGQWHQVDQTEPMVNATIRGGGRFEAILAVNFLIDDYTESYQRNDYRGDNPPWTQYLTADAFRAQLQFVLTLSDALDLAAAESSAPTASPDSTPDPNASSPAISDFAHAHAGRCTRAIDLGTVFRWNHRGMLKCTEAESSSAQGDCANVGNLARLGERDFCCSLGVSEN